jgi:hypothetical protein
MEKKGGLLLTVKDTFTTLPLLTTWLPYNFPVVYISSEHNRNMLIFWLEFVTAMNIITKVSA